MIEHLPTIAQLLKQLQQVPYLASKNIYRVVDYLLTIEQDKAEQLCKAILDAKYNIKQCDSCFVWKEHNRQCSFCDNAKRDATILCVVETWQELIAVEKTGGYNGLYHVLGGVISPLDGLGPEDLTIDQLVQRCIAPIQEVILATNQTPEGEATAVFIASRLKKQAIKVSCLARGIPVGSSLEYMDRLTVFKALNERRPF